MIENFLPLPQTRGEAGNTVRNGPILDIVRKWGQLHFLVRLSMGQGQKGSQRHFQSLWPQQLKLWIHIS